SLFRGGVQRRFWRCRGGGSAAHPHPVPAFRNHWPRLCRDGDCLMSELDLPQIAENQALAHITSNDADAALEAALCDEMTGHDPTAGNITLLDEEFRGHWHHVIAGSPAGAFDFIVPAIRRPFMVTNTTDATATVKTASGAAGQVLAGETRLFYCNGGCAWPLRQYGDGGRRRRACWGACHPQHRSEHIE